MAFLIESSVHVSRYLRGLPSQTALGDGDGAEYLVIRSLRGIWCCSPRTK